MMSPCFIISFQEVEFASQYAPFALECNWNSLVSSLIFVQWCRDQPDKNPTRPLISSTLHTSHFSPLHRSASRLVICIQLKAMLTSNVGKDIYRGQTTWIKIKYITSRIASSQQHFRQGKWQYAWNLLFKINMLLNFSLEVSGMSVTANLHASLNFYNSIHV
jgi:hypothetical protein